MPSRSQGAGKASPSTARKAGKKTRKRSKRRPESSLVGKAAYAAYRGVSRQQVTAWGKEGRLVLVHGRVDVRASDAILDGPAAASAVPAGARTGDEEIPGNVSVQEARRQKLLWDARRSRLLALAEGAKYLPRDDVERVIFTAVRSCRDMILALPARLRDRLAAESDPRRITEILTEALERSLESLAGDWRALASSASAADAGDQPDELEAPEDEELFPEGEA